jgi:L-rhamnose mutarotase
MARRVGAIIRIPADRFEEYKRRHDTIPAEIVDIIKGAHVQNFSIFHRDSIMFLYYEYVGNDFDGDVAAWTQNKLSVEWNEQMKGLLVPWEQDLPGAGWADMVEVFHTD